MRKYNNFLRCAVTLVCVLGLLASSTLFTSAAAASDTQVHIYPNRIVDMQGAKYQHSGIHATDLSGGLTLWRPKAVEEFAAMGDGGTHLRFSVKVNLAQMSKVYVKVAETTPVPINMMIMVKGVQVSFCNGQILEAGKEYCFDILKVYRDMFEDSTKKFPDVKKEYDFHLSALFEGAFSDTNRVKIESIYFAKDKVTYDTATGANEAIKVDFSEATVPEMMTVKVNKDGSMTVNNDHTDILFAQVTVDVDLNKTPYIYLDIEGHDPEDQFFMDLYNGTQPEGELRLLGFAELDKSRLAFRYDLRGQEKRLGLTDGKGKIMLSVGNYDYGTDTTYTIHGVYFGDEYFVYKGAMTSGGTNTDATTNVNVPDNTTSGTEAPVSTTVAGGVDNTTSGTEATTLTDSSAEDSAGDEQSKPATTTAAPAGNDPATPGSDFPWQVLVIVIIAVVAVGGGAYYLLLIHPYRHSKKDS